MQIPTSTLVRDYRTHTKDKTDQNIALGKERMDHYYTLLLAEANNYVVERTKYSKLKATQRSFLLPPDYIKMKRVRVKISSTWYRLTPRINLDQWADETSRDDITTTIPAEWNVINEQGNMHIELTDVPALDSNVINFEIIYEGYQDPLLFPDDYAIGTASLTQGDAAVTGSSDTAWTEAMEGRFLKVTNGKNWYEIASVASLHSLNLVNYFQERDIATSGYIIAEIPRLPHEFHKTPVWGAVAEYYKPSNTIKSKDFDSWYARDLLLLQSKYKSKTKGRVTPGRRIGGSLGGVPRNYPLKRIGT